MTLYAGYVAYARAAGLPTAPETLAHGITVRAQRYRERWPKIGPPSPEALAKHWLELGPPLARTTAVPADALPFNGPSGRPLTATEAWELQNG